jgi:hypothetical protein
VLTLESKACWQLLRMVMVFFLGLDQGRKLWVGTVES